MFSYSNASENWIGDFVLDPTFQGQLFRNDLCHSPHSPHLVDISGSECQGYRSLMKGQVCLHTPSQHVDTKPDTSLAT